MTHFQKEPISKVIDDKYCIGCGGCATVDSGLKMTFDKFGLLNPRGAISTFKQANNACPFAASKDEDSIGAELFRSEDTQHDSRIGYYRSVYLGHVTDPHIRSKGGSSGFVTWLLIVLLKRGMIDGVVHVKPSEEENTLFEYGVSTTTSEILNASKSRYYPVHFDKALSSIRGDGKRYAFVGVPCFIKSVRLICRQDTILRDQIHYCIALFCGHLKSASYSTFISAQVGLDRNELKSIDYRVKDPEQPANRYRSRVEGKRGESDIHRSLANQNLYGMDWGLGYFKPKACDWCDDIVGELADISSGDAWLSGYVNDPDGNNVVIVRSVALFHLVEGGRKDGSLKFGEGSSEDVYISQSGNFRHRREGLSIRIKCADEKADWHPRKRVSPEAYTVSIARTKLYKQREILSELSHHKFFRAGRNPLLFAIRMAPQEFKYYWFDGTLLRGSIKWFSRVACLAGRLLRYRLYK